MALACFSIFFVVVSSCLVRVTIHDSCSPILRWWSSNNSTCWVSLSLSLDAAWRSVLWVWVVSSVNFCAVPSSSVVGLSAPDSYSSIMWGTMGWYLCYLCLIFELYRSLTVVHRVQPFLGSSMAFLQLVELPYSVTHVGGQIKVFLFFLLICLCQLLVVLHHVTQRICRHGRCCWSWTCSDLDSISSEIWDCIPNMVFPY